MKTVILFFTIVAVCSLVIFLHYTNQIPDGLSAIVFLIILLGGSLWVAKRLQGGRKDA